MLATLGGASCCRRAARPLMNMSTGNQMKLVSRALSQLTIAPLPRPKARLPRCTLLPAKTGQRSATTASNSQWKARQSRDQFAKTAKVQGLKSRAAFKLLEMNNKYRFFKKNQVVIDLGYAPGSWSQVALDCTKPRGLVIGIDLIPAQPPRGVTSIQGDFLSPHVHKLVKEVLSEQIGRRRREASAHAELRKEVRKEKDAAAAAAAATAAAAAEEGELAEKGREEVAEEGQGQEEEQQQQQQQLQQQHEESESGADLAEGEESGIKGERETDTAYVKEKEEGSQTEENENQEEDSMIAEDRPSYIDMEKRASQEIEEAEAVPKEGEMTVDIVLSDMSEPWPQTVGFMSNTLSNPYRRLMNTSGMAFRDHVGSMDLCHAALQFASDTLKREGHFICKYYEGNLAKQFETKLRRMFKHVHRLKPASSRKESKEYFFVAMKRKHGVTLKSAEAAIAEEEERRASR